MTDHDRLMALTGLTERVEAACRSLGASARAAAAAFTELALLLDAPEFDAVREAPPEDNQTRPGRG